MLQTSGVNYSHKIEEKIVCQQESANILLYLTENYFSFSGIWKTP